MTYPHHTIMHALFVPALTMAQALAAIRKELRVWAPKLISGADVPTCAAREHAWVGQY